MDQYKELLPKIAFGATIVTIGYVVYKKYSYIEKISQNEDEEVYTHQDLPEGLLKRKDLYERLVKLSQQHFKCSASEVKNFTFKDCSGMSNPVFIVGRGNDKIIIRFFESAAADFKMENMVFKTAGDLGIGPESISTDGRTYRIEQFYPGVPLKFCQLMQESVLQKTMELLCKFNYAKFIDKQSEVPLTGLKAYEYIENKQKGWYWAALAAYETIHKIKKKVNIQDLGLKATKSLEVFEEVYDVFYKDQQAFRDEYLALLPKITEQNKSKLVIFSHNDLQENNIMVQWADDQQKEIQGGKLLDFEYSQPNYRGPDMAGYLVESTIDYMVKEEPYFRYHDDRMPDFSSTDPRSPINLMIKYYLETYFNTQLKESKDMNSNDKEALYKSESNEIKEQVKLFTLQQHLIWTSWSLLMVQPQLNQLVQEDGQVTVDEQKIKTTLEEIASFYAAYAKFRLDLYFTWRERLLPEQKTALKN